MIALARHGVRVVRDSATAIDLEKKQVRLARGEPVAFDRVVVSPGIDFMWEMLPAMQSDEADTSSLEVTVAELPAESDQVVDEDGARIFVEDRAIELLDDKLLDAQIDGTRVGFTLMEQRPL